MRSLYFFLVLIIIVFWINSSHGQSANPFGRTVRFFTTFENTNPFDSVLRSYIPNTSVSLWDTVGAYRFPINGNGKAIRGRINPNSTSILQLKPFSTLGHFKVWLDFAHIAKLEFNDTAIVQYSVDAGLTWTRLLGTACRYFGASVDFRNSSRFTQFSYPADWSPSSQGATPLASWWKQERFDLSAFVSNRSDVRIRFMLKDGNNNGLGSVPSAYGWLLDSIIVTSAISEQIPPIVSHIPLANIQFNLNQTISATINDSLGCDSTGVDTSGVHVFYKINNGSIDSVRMIRQGSSLTWSAILDSSRINDFDSVKYLIRARDASANRNVTYSPIQSNLGDLFHQYYIQSLNKFKIQNTPSCFNDTSSVVIFNPLLNGVANASLRIVYNSDSLTYVGFGSINPAFSGINISGGNGSIVINWNSTSNQIIQSGTMLNLRFKVNGYSNLSWDTVQFPCELSDVNFNLIPFTYIGGYISNNTKRFTWHRSICEGQSFNLGNQSYTTSGIYQGRRFGTGGSCDTLITLNLNVIPRQTILPVVTRCSNQPYFFNGLSLTSSGTYLDTLTNSLGCDSILQLNLTVNPSYNQNQSVVICTGTTYYFAGQNLTASGAYSHTYTTANGCDSLVQLNLSVADSVSIQSANGAVGFCPGGSLRIGLVNPIPNVSYQWTKDGSIMTGANTDSLMVTQSGVYQLTVQVSPTCSVISNSINISVLNCNRITGDLKYDNNNQTSLAGVPVHLKTLLGNIVASDTTDSAGVYDMTGYNNGNYVLDPIVNYVPGGINSTDALQVTRFFTSLISLSPLRIRVGDVNGSGITNSGDALLINRRITGLIPSFSVGNFVNNLPSVSASGNPIAANLRVLSTGDVNGTYNPISVTPVLVLDTVYGNGNVGTAVVRLTNPGAGVFERGIVWSSSPNPTVSSSKSVAGSGGFGFTHTFPLTNTTTVQYARAYARTNAGVYYSTEKSFSSVPWNRCPGTPSVTDIDGNVYNTVQIGTQCWTQSNLKTSKYRNGLSISTGNNAWQSTITGAFAFYDNNVLNDNLFGKLYNHNAVTDSSGLCPTGWHIPSRNDFEDLANAVGGRNSAALSLRSTSVLPNPQGWANNNSGSNNISGFSALGGGLRDPSGVSSSLNQCGLWWTTTIGVAGSPTTPYAAVICLGNNELSHSGGSLGYGFSVRCLKNTLPQVNTSSVTGVTHSSALVMGEVISEGDQNTTRGFCYSTTYNPTISNESIMNGTGLGVYSGTLQNLTPLTTYYVRAYATNSVGTSYGSELSFTTDSLPGLRCPGIPTVTDIDGNVYSTVQIGAQCWTQSNLKVSKYRNGDNIPTGLSNGAWQGTTSGAYAMYNNDPVNDGLYGKLYNHYAVTDSRGLCPTGWHVPSDGEWKVLTKYLDPSADTNTASNTVSTTAGGALKSTATQPTPGGWSSPNTGATNSSGFTAPPGGFRFINGGFGYLTDYGNWWSSSVLSASNAWSRDLFYFYSDIFRNYNGRTLGFSVRCCRD